MGGKTTFHGAHVSSFLRKTFPKAPAPSFRIFLKRGLPMTTFALGLMRDAGSAGPAPSDILCCSMLDKCESAGRRSTPTDRHQSGPIRPDLFH